MGLGNQNETLTIPFGEEQREITFETTKGFAAIRVLTLPISLVDVIKSDEYIGFGVLRKVIESETVPEWFKELAVVRQVEENITNYEYPAIINDNEFTHFIDAVLGPMDEDANAKYRSFPYVTWFPTPFFSRVVPILEQATQEVMARFDDFGDRFLATNPEIVTNTEIVEISGSDLTS